MENEVRGCKRDREEPVEGFPEAKKIRDELILEILDDDDEDVIAGDDRIPVEDGLEEFMKSFEEEIAAPALLTALEGFGTVTEGQTGVGSDEMGFLLEASDDELGLPPTFNSSVSKEEEVGVSSDGDGVDPIWGFEDEISSFYDGFNPVVQRDDDNNGNDVLVFGDGLFDSDLTISWPSDFADLFWLPESSPAF